MKSIVCGIVGILFSFNVLAQQIELGDPQTDILRQKQWDIFATIHTNGFGLGGRIGRIHNIHYQSGFDFEWTFYRDFKEKMEYVTTEMSTARFFFTYGKLCYFEDFRFGYGFTRILSQKPYWGGVEIGYFLYGGLSLAISVPVYLDVPDYNSSDGSIKKLRASEEFYENPIPIKRKYSFFKSFEGTKVHPGAYIKTGFSFDFAKNEEWIVKLDVGVAADLYGIPVKKVAFTPQKYVLVVGYLSMHIGKNKAKYEIVKN